MDIGMHTTIFSIRQILNSLPNQKNTLKLSGVTFGKRIRNIPLKSKVHSLTQTEITRYTRNLMMAFKNWSTYGDNNWIITESEGIRFTVLFIRKETVEYYKFIGRR